MRNRRPFTVPDEPELLKRLNDTSMGIKIHHFPELTDEKQKAITDKLKGQYPAPSWQDVDELLLEAYHVIEEYHHDPRKYRQK